MGQEAKQLMHRERPRDMRHNFTVRVTEHWNRPSRLGAECPSLEILKIRVDAIPCHVLRDDPAGAGRQEQTLLTVLPASPCPSGAVTRSSRSAPPAPARAETAPAASAALSAVGPGHGTRGRRRERGEEREEKKPKVTSPAAAGPGRAGPG